MKPPTSGPASCALERTRFLEAVLDSAVDYAIIALDLDGYVQEWPEGAHRILGWTAEEMIGRHLSTFFLPEDVAAGIPEAEMRGAREQGRASDERWHMHRDGTRFFALGEMMPMRDENATLVGYLKILRDRTQQRLAEDALRDREAFLSSVLASSGDCIKVLDLDGRLSFMTEAGQKVMEVADFNALCGVSWPTLWKAAERVEAEAAIRAARSGGVGHFQGFCPTLKGTPKHWDVVVTPIRGADGEIANLLAISRDITAIRSAEAARDAAETKATFDENLLTAIFRAAPVGISVTDAKTGNALFLNDALRTMLGSLDGQGSIGRYQGYGAKHRDGRPYAEDDYPTVRVLKTGRPVPWEDMLWGQPGADMQLFEVTSAPVHDLAGDLVAAVTILTDVSEERSAKAEIAKLAALVEQSSDLISMAALDGSIDYINPAGVVTLGLASLADARTRGLTQFFTPESQDVVQQDAMPALLRGERWEGALALRSSQPGAELPVWHTIFPVRDMAGTVTSFGAVTRDRSAQQAEEERRRMLSNELSHRMKNMLAMVQSIAFQTLRSSADLSSARDTLSARIVAMSKAHDLLLEDKGHSADIRTVVAAAVAPHDDVVSRFVAEGPSLAVGPRAAMALSLMLHELATNAAKYGALRAPEGQVTIEWSVSDELFVLRWRECGGPPVVAPTRAGFGTRLIERGLAADVGGKVTLNYAREGVTCEMRAAMAGLQAGN